MKPVFADANGWIALNSKRDQGHDIAVNINKGLLQEGHRYVTTNFVLDETYTGLLTKVGHFSAADFGEKSVLHRRFKSFMSRKTLKKRLGNYSSITLISCSLSPTAPRLS